LSAALTLFLMLILPCFDSVSLAARFQLNIKFKSADKSVRPTPSLLYFNLTVPLNTVLTPCVVRTCRNPR
jgi:hypothetical protein